MAQPIILTLIFIALIPFTSVSAFRTHVFTTTFDEDGYVVFTTRSREQQSCQKEIRSDQLTECDKYLEQKSPYDGDVLEMTVVDTRKNKEMKLLEQCCKELHNVKKECQCEAVQEVFRQAAQQQQAWRHGSSEEQRQKQILRKAQNLPSICQLKVQQCRIRYPYI